MIENDLPSMEFSVSSIQRKRKGEQDLINEVEFERENQEEVLGSPSSNLKDQFVSCNLEETFEIMGNFSSLDKMEKVDDYLKEKKRKAQKEE